MARRDRPTLLGPRPTVSSGTDERETLPTRPTLPLRVYVVEDQVKVLKQQLKLLEADPAVTVVGTALSGEAGIPEIEKLEPDVVLLDLSLPGMSGIEITRKLKASRPKLEVLIFTTFDEEAQVLEAVRAGASGYLLKGTPKEKLIEAMQEICTGGTVIQPSLARALLKQFKAPSEPAPHSPEPSAPLREEPVGKQLSDREHEILTLIAKGVSNPEAAQMLGVSRATIRTHLEHIYKKLDVTNRVEAVTEALRKGLIQM